MSLIIERRNMRAMNGPQAYCKQEGDLWRVLLLDVDESLTAQVEIESRSYDDSEMQKNVKDEDIYIYSICYYSTLSLRKHRPGDKVRGHHSPLRSVTGVSVCCAI